MALFHVGDGTAESDDAPPDGALNLASFGTLDKWMPNGSVPDYVWRLSRSFENQQEAFVEQGRVLETLVQRGRLVDERRDSH